tara:strand:+ start:20010 stop:20789 length:780 start_codon:yes stop_codon:yes gene_type:complete
MKFHHIEIHDGVATITLDRPELHNAFNEELISELTQTFKGIGSGVRVVVLKGEGKSFCAGADLNWMKKMVDYTRQENVADAQELANLFKAIDDCPAPVVGVAHGAVLGGGAGLIAVCDYVLAAEDTVFGFTEARLGLVPAVISPFVMAKIGVSAARATFMSGRRFKAAEALRIGLVHQVCNPAMLSAELDNITSEFKKAGPQASREAKQLIKGVLERAHNKVEQINFTCETIATLRASDEGQEGMSALLEKRRPQWIKS